MAASTPLSIAGSRWPRGEPAAAQRIGGLRGAWGRLSSHQLFGSGGGNGQISASRGGGPGGGATDGLGGWRAAEQLRLRRAGQAAAARAKMRTPTTHGS